mmetsp:Transcript_31787/g.83278  ORF Transcript_31787/g.83278 Transcript_31787/m.83278 type:complete len:616 (+) Transcript_31787:264-2111(+)
MADATASTPLLEDHSQEVTEPVAGWTAAPNATTVTVAVARPAGSGTVGGSQLFAMAPSADSFRGGPDAGYGSTNGPAGAMPMPLHHEGGVVAKANAGQGTVVLRTRNTDPVSRDGDSGEDTISPITDIGSDRRNSGVSLLSESYPLLPRKNGDSPDPRRGDGGGDGGSECNDDAVGTAHGAAADGRKRASMGIAGGPGPRIGRVAAVLSLVRASVGPGAMALPYAFSQSGISVGLGLLVIFTVVIFVNMRTLVRLKQTTKGAQTYGDVGEACLGPAGRVVVEVSLTGMELGICTVYFSYISTNLGTVLGGEWNDDAGHRRLMLLLLPVLAAFGLITRMSVVAAMSTAANVLMAAALLIVWFYLSFHVEQHGPEKGTVAPQAGEMHKLLLTLATIIYSFEGCGAVLPIENAMETPRHFGAVLWLSFATFFTVYALMGILGAMAFDYDTPGLLPDDRGSVSAVIAFFYSSGVHQTVGKVLNGLLAVTVAMTYPIQFFAAIEVLELHVGLSSRCDHWAILRGQPAARRAARVALRCATVTATMILAYAIPKLSLIIALFGAVFGGMIELILPPLLLLCDSGHATSAHERGLNRVLLVVGLVAVLGGTAQAIYSIVVSF